MTKPTIQTSAPNELKEILTTHNVHNHRLITRMVQKWNLEQEVVVAYYAIRNIRYDSITAIMARKFNTNRRTRKQIVHKVKCLRSQGVLPRDARGSFRLLNGQDWMLKHTDRWILRTVGKERLDILLDHDGKTAVIIDDVTALKTSSKV